MHALMDIWHITEGTPTSFMKLSFIPLKLYTNDIVIMGNLDNQASIIRYDMQQNMIYWGIYLPPN